jgi:hypothetical protein
MKRILTPWKVLIAMVAICASTTSARADVWLGVTDVSQSPVNTTYYDLTTTNGSGGLNVTNYAGQGQFNLVGLTGTLSHANGKLPETLTLSGSVAGTGSGNDTLSLNVFTSTSTSGTPILPWSGALKDGGTAGDTGYMTSSLKVTAGDPGVTVSSFGTYYYNPTGSVSTIAVDTKGSSGGTLTSGVVAVPNLSKFYDLAGTTTELSKLGSGKTLHFTASTTVALPEPSGVIAAFAGMPFMAGLLGFARRLRGRAETAAAAV